MTTLTIPPQLISDLDTFARHYQHQRGFVLLRLHARGSSQAWRDASESTDDLAAVVAAYDPAREYVVVVIAPDPEQPGSQLVQWQRRAYGGMLVMSA